MTHEAEIAIVGGGPAGLSAALTLGRACRRVVVIDHGHPRNAAARVSHGLLSRDGVSPGELLAVSLEQLRAYPHVEFLRDTVADVVTQDGRLHVTTISGRVFRPRKLILAVGLTDVLPAIPGLAECWGTSVFDCPYCHAWEYRDRPLALIDGRAGVLGVVAILRSWSDDIVLLTNGSSAMDRTERTMLHRSGIAVYNQEIASFRHEAGELEGVIFKEGSFLPRSAILYHPPMAQASDLPARLGLIRGGQFQVNPRTAQSANPDIYVAGDAAGLFTPPTIPTAIYGGAFAARNAHHAVAIEDFKARAARE